jgi:hypothetical protein
MRAENMSESLIDCLSPSGRRVAVLRITPASDASTITHDSSTQTARLHENGRYWCELISSEPKDAHLQCSLFRAKAPAQRETWLMETGAHAGLLRIVVQDYRNRTLGAAWIEVRSLKLHEREHYRAMLNDISERMHGLLHDLRSSSMTPLNTTWCNEPNALQQQLAFLCEAIEAPAFHQALQRIVAAPHRALQREPATHPIRKPFRQNAAFAHQLAGASQRLPLPAQHPLAAITDSVPTHVTATQPMDDLNTPENQFVKFVLERMRDFLSHAAHALRASGADWHAPAQRAEQDEHLLAQWLTHPFFAALSGLRKAPLGSAVLQRKAGYREMLHTWLRFQAGAQLTWNAAEDLFHAGQRDTAQLYEYWLFFQLLEVFCTRFDVAQPPAHALIERSANGWLLRLKHGEAGPPIIGMANGVRAQFQYNRTFAAPHESWTQSMRPDFTFTFWPVGMTQAEAMAQSRLKHLHFDAKYRVEKLTDLTDFENRSGPGANHDDLLKMHAYRDAIRHTGGAYVLYPGRGAPALLRRDDDTLPSLGAFAMMPGMGVAHGIRFLNDFLNSMRGE